MNDPYLNPQYSPRERALDLLSRMDLEEKLAQLQCCMPAMTQPGQVAQEFPYGVGQVAGFT